MKTRPITDLFDARSASIEPHETLRDYHYRRIDRINDGEFDVEEDQQGIILTHVASVDSLGPYLADRIDVEWFFENVKKIPLIKRSSYSDFNGRFDLCARGVKATKHSNDGTVAYTWVDRTGVLESITTDLIYEKKNEEMTITTETLERSLTNLITWYLEYVHESDDDPVFITISYLNMDGINTSRIGRGFGSVREIETSFIETPIVPVSEGNVREQLTPLLRPFWQEVNYTKSPYMTENGWKFNEDND